MTMALKQGGGSKGIVLALSWPLLWHVLCRKQKAFKIWPPNIKASIFKLGHDRAIDVVFGMDLDIVESWSDGLLPGDPGSADRRHARPQTLVRKDRTHPTGSGAWLPQLRGPLTKRKPVRKAQLYRR